MHAALAQLYIYTSGTTTASYTVDQHGQLERYEGRHGQQEGSRRTRCAGAMRRVLEGIYIYICRDRLVRAQSCGTWAVHKLAMMRS